MKRRAKHAQNKRLGAVMIWVAILLPVIIIFTGFTTDLGIVYMAQAELQATADAAALAAGNELPGRDPVLAASFDENATKDIAVDYAEKNLDPAIFGTVLRKEDIEFGFWDKPTRTFSPNTKPYNGVRVLTRRDSLTANKTDNSVNLVFLRILSWFGSNQDAVDLTAEAIALSGPKVGGEVSGGIIGIEWVEMGGNGFMDGYDPTSSDPYGVNGNEKLDSGILSNGYTENYGNSYLYGTARSGPGEDHDVRGNATVTKGAFARHSRFNFNSVDPPQGVNTVMNNNGVLNGLAGYNAGNKSLRNGPQDTGTIPAGNYYFSSLDIKGSLSIIGPAKILVDGTLKVNSQAEISVDGTAGPVELYLSGEATFNGQGITNVGQQPHDLMVLALPTTSAVKWNGGSDFYGYIYAPDSDLTINGNGDFYGGAVGRTADISGTGDVHADAVRGLPLNNDPIARLVH